ncbi:MAG: 3'(2'),5'-bisphosphate nucleotidase CysQ [Firmicutes bacterium]|nr:3'(2'),5'-bisphosphate nucleotidase CysQ [Bacillota bacterium]
MEHIIATIASGDHDLAALSKQRTIRKIAAKNGEGNGDHREMAETADFLTIGSKLWPFVEQARTAIKQIYHHHSYHVQMKADQSPVTEADWASHEILGQGLRQVTPQWPFISEETAQADQQALSVQDVYWLMDPLDGTKEFIGRTGEFTINLGLIADRSPIFGLIDVPLTGETYMGGPQMGLYRKTAQADWQRVEVSAALSRKNAAVFVQSRSHGRDEIVWLQQLGIAAAQHKILGSALKFCALAQGCADLYPRLAPCSAWDTAAGHALIKAGGGEVVTRSGQFLSYDPQRLINEAFIATGTPYWTHSVQQALASYDAANK